MKLITMFAGTFLMTISVLPLMAQDTDQHTDHDTSQDTGDKGVYFYTADQVKGTFAKDPHAPGSSSNGKAGTLSSVKENSGKFQVGVRRHDEGNEPEVHNDRYHIFYVLEGKCTFVTGGKLVGKTLEGGRTWNLDKGSVIVVPTGIVHWFKSVPAEAAPWLAFSVEVYSNTGYIEPVSSYLPGK